MLFCNFGLPQTGSFAFYEASISSAADCLINYTTVDADFLSGFKCVVRTFLQEKSGWENICKSMKIPT